MIIKFNGNLIFIGDVGVEGFNSDKLAKELNSAMSDLPSFDSGLVSAVLKDMWSKVIRLIRQL